jgi:hypothetical protein
VQPATPDKPSAFPADRKPSIVVPRSRLARWLEAVEGAIEAESERQRVDILCDLAASLEDAWLAPEAAA